MTKVLVASQGLAVLSNEGYLLKKSVDVATFYVDAWGKYGRAYCFATSQHDGCPSIWLTTCEDNKEEEPTIIYFPEFKGFDVFAVHSGKTLSVCLRKD